MTCEQGVTVVAAMQIICANLNFIFSAASDATHVSCTPTSSQQILGRRQRSDEEDCGQKKPRTTDVTCTPSSSQEIMGRHQRQDEVDCGQKKPRTTPQLSQGQ